MAGGILKTSKYSSGSAMQAQPSTSLVTDLPPLPWYRSSPAKAIYTLLLCLWFAPMYYLLLHEGGHCAAFKLLKRKGERSTLFLGCGDTSDPLVFSRNSNFIVCWPYFYSFVAQVGYCEYDGGITFTKTEDIVLSLAGSFVGALGMYVFLLIALQIVNKGVRSMRDKEFALAPFRLFKVLADSGIENGGLYNTVLGCVSVGYVMNINRIFYAVAPTTPDALTFPTSVADLMGDGFDIWSRYGGMSEGGLVVFAQCCSVVQYLCIGAVAWRAKVSYRRERASSEPAKQEGSNLL